MKVLRAPTRVRRLSPRERDAVDRAAKIETAAHAKGVARAQSDAAALLLAATAEAERLRVRDEEAVVAIVRESVSRVLGRETALSGDAVRDIVRVATRKLTRARRIVVRVHHDDVEAIRTAGASAFDPNVSPTQWDVVADDGLSRGDAVIDTDIGSIDARLSTQVEAIARALRGSST